MLPGRPLTGSVCYFCQVRLLVAAYPNVRTIVTAPQFRPPSDGVYEGVVVGGRQRPHRARQPDLSKPLTQKSSPVWKSRRKGKGGSSDTQKKAGSKENKDKSELSENSGPRIQKHFGDYYPDEVGGSRPSHLPPEEETWGPRYLYHYSRGGQLKKFSLSDIPQAEEEESIPIWEAFGRKVTKQTPDGGPELSQNVILGLKKLVWKSSQDQKRAARIAAKKADASEQAGVHVKAKRWVEDGETTIKDNGAEAVELEEPRAEFSEQTYFSPAAEIEHMEHPDPTELSSDLATTTVAHDAPHTPPMESELEPPKPFDPNIPFTSIFDDFDREWLKVPGKETEGQHFRDIVEMDSPVANHATSIQESSRVQELEERATAVVQDRSEEEEALETAIEADLIQPPDQEVIRKTATIFTRPPIEEKAEVPEEIERDEPDSQTLKLEPLLASQEEAENRSYVQVTGTPKRFSPNAVLEQFKSKFKDRKINLKSASKRRGILSNVWEELKANISKTQDDSDLEKSLDAIGESLGMKTGEKATSGTGQKFDPGLFNSLFEIPRQTVRSIQPVAEKIKRETEERIAQGRILKNKSEYALRRSSAFEFIATPMESSEMHLNNMLAQALRSGNFWEAFDLLHKVQSLEVMFSASIRHDYGRSLIYAAMDSGVKCSPEQLVSLVLRLEELESTEPMIYVMTLRELIRLDRPDLLNPIFQKATQYSPEYGFVGVDLDSLSSAERSLAKRKSNKYETLWIWTYIAFLLMRKRGYITESLETFEKSLPWLRRPVTNYIVLTMMGQQKWYFGKLPLQLVSEISDYNEFATLDIMLKQPRLLWLKIELIQQSKKVPKLEDLYQAIMNNPLLKKEMKTNHFSMFIAGFMSLGKQDEAVKIWNQAIETGNLPSLRSWNALLLGCAVSKDMQTMNEVWKRMLDSGETPDTVCWTTKAYGLFRCNHIADGILALSEMTAAGIQPTTDTINAAIDGLTRHGYLNESLAVVREGIKVGVVADMITYNTLLRGMLRHHKYDHAIAILNIMERSGFQPDIITFTTILDATTKSRDSHIDMNFIDEYLEAMSGAKEQPNVQTYSSLIQALLRKNLREDAQKVLLAMKIAQVKPNAHTYTILINWYGKQYDFDQIGMLLKEMENYKIIKDPILYQAIIKVFAIYAPVGALKGEPSWGTLRMMEYFGKMRDERLVPNMPTYVSVLKRLIKEELKDMAWNVVQEAYENLHDPNKEVIEMRWSNLEFWAVVEELRKFGWWDSTPGALSSREDVHDLLQNPSRYHFTSESTERGADDEVAQVEEALQNKSLEDAMWRQAVQDKSEQRRDNMP